VWYRGVVPGCGTGRVLVPLAEECAYIHGLDLSEGMVAVCRKRLQAAGVAPTKAQAEVRDIANSVLDQKFDLIIAPYRALQNLETDAAVTGVFECIRRQLASDGSCVLNVFRPYADPDILRREWCTEHEKFCWEVAIKGGRVTCHDRRPRMDPDQMILYPDLIYRHYRGEALVDEATLDIAMRCYYPEEFVQLILDNGFRVLRQWGGYADEPYGRGSELVVQFTHDRV
jgi:SAM-dependent methyltransferase